MKRFMMSGVLALAIAVPGLLAQPKPKSKGEVEALQALFKAQSPDERIAAAENVLTKYADTEFKSVALFMEADAYQQKHDYENTVVYGERSLEADPKNYGAMLLLAQQIVQHTKEFDLDKEEKLAKVDKYAKGAIDTVKDASKPNTNLTDDQWAGAKKQVTAQSHVTMGMAAMLRKKPDVAAAEFKTSLEGDDKPDPATLVRLGVAYSQDGKYDDAVAQFDKVMAMPDVSSTIKQYAQAERVRTIQKKNPGGASTGTSSVNPATPPKPAAPDNPPATPPTPPADPKKE